jgi:hypothetical protein
MCYIKKASFYFRFKLLDSARVASVWRRVESPKYSK